MALKLSMGLYGMEQWYGGDFAGVIDAVREAEQAGFDQIAITDHVVMGERTDRYPYGDFPSPPDYPWIEPMTMMAVLAGATRRIRLSTSVLIAPLRPAVLLAKMAASLDVLSGGRLDLGVGTGWQQEEYAASGIPFADRRQRLVDQLRACRALWREAPASFQSTTVSFDRIYCRPAPLQPEGVPLWFGLAPNATNCRIIAELGTGWIPINPDPDYVAAGARQIGAAFEQAGRPRDQLRIRAQLALAMNDRGIDLDATLAGVARSREAGVTDLEFLPFLFIR